MDARLTFFGLQAATDERWRRPALADLVLLVAAVALGMACAVRGFRGTVPPFAPATGSLAGALIAGPLLLLGQLLRGRRLPLMLGEWLWLTQGAVIGVGALGLYATPTGLGYFYQILVGLFWVAIGFVSVAYSLLALVYLAMRTIGRDENPARLAWTDPVGMLVCLIAGPCAAFLVFAYFLA